MSKTLLKPLVIGDLTVPIPIIQAGMGVQVAKSELAGAVGRANAVGCISTVGIGTLEGHLNNYIEESNKRLDWQLKNARKLAPGGVLAVNIMMALSNYDEIVKVCVRNKVDMIITGAGLPLSLPGLTKGSGIKLIPVISSGRSLAILLKAWHRRYRKMPDAVIVEGPLCGGHLAFTRDQISHPQSVSIQKLFADVKEVLAPYEAEYQMKIPVLGAENIATAKDVMNMLALGFDGVQIGTRFILTEESGIAPKSKEVYRKAKDSDVTVIQSPLGMPLRVLNTGLVPRILNNEKIPFKCPFRCLRACEAGKVKFCLANALVNTLFGDTENAVFMVGSAIGRINDIIPAEEFFVPFRKML